MSSVIALNPNKALWEKGDFTRIAAAMRESGDALVESLGITPCMEILDLGCGDGTTALPAARRGANVLGVDIAANLVAAGRARAKAENLRSLHFQEGDASRLTGIESNSFDLVISIFGAMFAPYPLDVASEMVRVTKPGGRIEMGNWIPGDPTLVAQILRISAGYSPPPPPGFVSPMRWGVEEEVIERFGAAGVSREHIRCTRATYVFDHAGSPSSFLDLFQNYYGPTMNAFDAAWENGRLDQLRAELENLFAEQNVSRDPGRTRIPATYMRVSVDVV